MSIIPGKETYEADVQYHHTGVTTSSDALMNCFNIGGFPDSYTIKGPCDITQMYLLWDGELVDSWSAGTLQFRVYNKGVLILDTGTHSNTLTKDVSFTGILTVTSAMSDLSSIVNLPLTLNDEFTAIQVRVTASGLFPAIDTEVGIQLFLEKPI